jgi:hypothetical protein
MDLATLGHWAAKWQIRFNTNKCKVMHMKRTGDKAGYIMADGGRSTVFEESKLARDLGVWMGSDLKFSGHVAKVVSKANQQISHTAQTTPGGQSRPKLARWVIWMRKSTVPSLV